MENILVRLVIKIMSAYILCNMRIPVLKIFVAGSEKLKLKLKLKLFASKYAHLQ